MMILLTNMHGDQGNKIVIDDVDVLVFVIFLVFSRCCVFFRTCVAFFATHVFYTLFVFQNEKKC